MTLLKCGYLTKEGHHMKNWKKRFFMLYSDETVGCAHLAYFLSDEKTDGEALGVIPLTKNLSIESYGEVKEEEKGLKGFKRKLVKMGSKVSLVSSGRHLGNAGWKMSLKIGKKKIALKLGAESEDNAREWIAALRSASESSQPPYWPDLPSSQSVIEQKATTEQQLDPKRGIEEVRDMESFPSLESVRAVARRSSAAQFPQSESRGFLYIKRVVNNDFTKEWERRYCLFQDGYIFFFEENTSQRTAFDENKPPIGGFPVAGAVLSTDAEIGCVTVSIGTKVMAFFPGEESDGLLRSIARSIGGKLEDWVQFGGLHGPTSLVDVGRYKYQREVAAMLEPKLLEMIGDEESAGSSSDDKEEWAEILEKAPQAAIHFFSDLKKTDVLFLMRREGDEEPSLHRLRVYQRVDKAIEAGKPPRTFRILYPVSMARHLEISELFSIFHKACFYGPLFSLHKNRRFEELKEKCPNMVDSVVPRLAEALNEKLNVDESAFQAAPMPTKQMRKLSLSNKERSRALRSLDLMEGGETGLITEPPIIEVEETVEKRHTETESTGALPDEETDEEEEEDTLDSDDEQQDD